MEKKAALSKFVKDNNIIEEYYTYDEEAYQKELEKREYRKEYAYHQRKVFPKG